MGKGENPKAIEARERKAAKAAVEAAQKKAAEEDAYWSQAEGKKSKAQLKREAQNAQRTEASLKKQEAKQLAKEEQTEMDSFGKKPPKQGSKKKVTAAEIAKMQEEKRKAMEEERKKKKDEVSVEDYERSLDVENRNREEGVISATGINDAIAAIALNTDGIADNHPEKRVRAAFKTYEAQELQALKVQKPGLAMSQYRELMWKSFKKSSQNPLNPN